MYTLVLTFVLTDWADVFVKAKRLGKRISRGKTGCSTVDEELVVSVQNKSAYKCSAIPSTGGASLYE